MCTFQNFRIDTKSFAELHCIPATCTWLSILDTSNVGNTAHSPTTSVYCLSPVCPLTLVPRHQTLTVNCVRSGLAGRAADPSDLQVPVRDQVQAGR